jgi:hypothetical protein
VTTPGREETHFPGFDVTGQEGTWDPVTTRIVLGRLRPKAPGRFFTAQEEPAVRRLLDRLLAQDDEPRIPVFELVDERLAERSGDGFRHAHMPEDREAWRTSIAGLDDDAEGRHGRRFADLDNREQMRLIEGVRTADGEWRGLPGKQVFSLWMRYTCGAFYSHPWAWNEIGFGGPAYPRGYKNLGFDRREPWEVAEEDRHDRPWPERARAARRRHAAALGAGDEPRGPC